MSAAIVDSSTTTASATISSTSNSRLSRLPPHKRNKNLNILATACDSSQLCFRTSAEARTSSAFIPKHRGATSSSFVLYKPRTSFTSKSSSPGLEAAFRRTTVTRTRRPFQISVLFSVILLFDVLKLNVVVSGADEPDKGKIFILCKFDPCLRYF